jgi:hypothetical protein
VSLLSVIQTGREIALWEFGRRAYDEQYPQDRTFSFAGHTFSVTDDQPVDSEHSQTAHEGTIQLLLDGHPLGPLSRARVRRGLQDLGRYHLWLSARIFRDRVTGEKSLWLARRLQPTEGDSPEFEVTEVTHAGGHETRIFSAYQLGAEYRRFRATQIVRDGLWTVFPLSLSEVAGFAPVFLLLFPFGTLVVGLLLVRSRRPGGGVS